MSILTPTEFTATVTWLGLVPPDLGEDDIKAVPVEMLELDWGGPLRDVHHGLTRAACVRVRRQYPEGTEIRNARQLSILSEEEMAEVAEGLGLERLAPEWLGASMVIRGIPDFTAIPPASRLIFEGGAALLADTENEPCRFPADEIERVHPGHGRAFPRIAAGRRGITASVERPGVLRLGESARLHVPRRRPWPHG
jgi:hypothetical protein